MKKYSTRAKRFIDDEAFCNDGSYSEEIEVSIVIYLCLIELPLFYVLNIMVFKIIYCLSHNFFINDYKIIYCKHVSTCLILFSFVQGII